MGNRLRLKVMVMRRKYLQFCVETDAAQNLKPFYLTSYACNTSAEVDSGPQIW